MIDFTALENYKRTLTKTIIGCYGAAYLAFIP
jgi:hypothetical protein